MQLRAPQHVLPIIFTHTIVIQLYNESYINYDMDFKENTAA